MNYFQLRAHSRQAVFGFSLLFVLFLTANIIAQEQIKQTDEPQTNAETTEKNQTSSTAKKSDASEKVTDQKNVAQNDQQFTVRKFSAFSKDENRQFRASSDNSTTETTKAESQQQSSDSDDTMMGVMGKGTDSIKLGGHVGFVVPIVLRGNGVTTNVGDRFVFGFPVGLTLKTKRNIAIDFEFIPTFNTGRDFVLTIHPGIIYGFAKHYAVGVRAAYDAGAGSFGFTPLVSRGFKINKKVGFFIEADFPVRSNYRAYQDRFGSIAFAAHAGFAF